MTGSRAGWQKREKMEFSVEFLTPAFLGDAEQKAAWRTPPFKALLRQWWRVVAAKDCNYNHGDLLKAENRLFGSGGEKDGGKSLVRMRLTQNSAWQPGTVADWRYNCGKVKHPEVSRVPQIAADLYLGYGPLDPQRGQTNLRSVVKNDPTSQRTAIAPKTEQAELTLWFSPGVSDGEVRQIHQALQFIHFFGTLGSRSRNGWGSLALKTDQMDFKGWSALFDRAARESLLRSYSLELSTCLSYEHDWPHALGRDTKGLLLWKTKSPKPKWEEVIRDLAETKIVFRADRERGLPFSKEPGRMDDRHLLAYPVTNHEVSVWKNHRLANSLRFKVIEAERGKYRGLIVHLPCALPSMLSSDLNGDDEIYRRKDKQLQVWAKVHQTLDSIMERLP